MANAILALPLDHPKRQVLLEHYLQCGEGLLTYQSVNGLWRQLIDYPNAWEETSGWAMSAYAMVTGIRLGWLDKEKYRPIVEKAWLALVDKRNENGELEEVCIGANEELTAQNYLNRKRRTGDHHGQGSLPWIVNVIILLDKSMNS